MGVTQLWNILEPVKHQGDLASLKGKRLCVDLSGWICEAQGAKKLKANVLKPHLRNLFFRVWNLTRVGVKLVFVVDGEAPEVKWEAIARRNEARHGYNGGRGRGKSRGQRKKVGRSNFSFLVKECTTLLTLLGIPHIESDGEAEALCAWMNAKGIVDGCITNDGDAFLYGARTVYKDLCVSNKECTMDYYSMDDVEDKLGLDRDKLVGLAILLGCDYLPQGVPGVGKEMGLKLVQALGGVKLLQRLQDWSNFDVSEDGMSKIEKSIKQKALKVGGFPSQEVINEFMSPELKTQNLTVPKDYNCPDLKQLLVFCWNYLEWPEDYTKEKVLPLVTYWQMETKLSFNQCTQWNIVIPDKIIKARVQNKIECYEVIWHSDDIDDGCPFTTTETRELFGQVYATLVEVFESVQRDKKNKKTGKTKPKKSPQDIANDNKNMVEDLCSNLDALSLSVTDSLNPPKLYSGEEVCLSQDEATGRGFQDTKPGNPLPAYKNILRGLQENPKMQHQQDKKELEVPLRDGAKHVQERSLALNKTKVQTGSTNLKGEENFKLKVKKCSESESSSEDEMSDSLFCEFVAPLSQRIQGQCSTSKCYDTDTTSHHNRGKPNEATKTSINKDLKYIKDHKEFDNRTKLILIDSSEDEEESDVDKRTSSVPDKKVSCARKENSLFPVFSCADRASAKRTSQVQEIQQEFCENFSSNPKPKVIPRVSFSSESSDDDDNDDSWNFSPNLAIAERNLTKNTKSPKKEKLVSNNFGDAKPYLTTEDIQQDKHLNSTSVVTPDGKRHEINKNNNKTFIHFKANKMDFDNVTQRVNLPRQSSTCDLDLACCSNEADKGPTPKGKSIEKTKEEKKNVDSPLEEVFVPLSLSERLGKHLLGRRNVFSTLCALSSNKAFE